VLAVCHPELGSGSPDSKKKKMLKQVQHDRYFQKVIPAGNAAAKRSLWENPDIL
jgi:hypothetical protein